jgi:hypothetical protein
VVKKVIHWPFVASLGANTITGVHNKCLIYEISPVRVGGQGNNWMNIADFSVSNPENRGKRYLMGNEK